MSEVATTDRDNISIEGDHKKTISNGKSIDEDSNEPKTNGTKEKKKTYAYSDDDLEDDLSSSDSDSDGPPPMITIEKSQDIGALKSALHEKIQGKKIEKPEVKVCKENLTSLASTFEKGGLADNTVKVERENPLAFVDKEQYSSFKQKFERIDKVMAEKDEERKSLRSSEIQGVGVEGLMKAKDKFEQLKDNQANSTSTEQRVIDIERSETDKKRIQKTFFEANDKEEPKECAVCGKMVYSMEKMQLEKKVFHRSCFKCCKCQKSLSVQNYTTCEGELYCKLHIMEKFNPDIALSHELAESMTLETEPDEEEEYALVTKPKALDPSIVKSGLKSTDDLENIPHLKDRKNEWTEQAAASKVEKRTEIDAEVFKQGKVKDRMSKFVDGEAQRKETDEEAVEEDGDPNVAKESKKREKINIEIGAKSLKSKWESGTMESVQGDVEDRSEELNELKRNVSIKERFKERTTSEDETKRSSTLADMPIDVSSVHAAKERFLKGDAFRETSPSEKTKDDVKFSELGNVKERFERVSTEEHQRSDYSQNIVRATELGDIKASFEQGGKKKFTEEELEARKKDHLEREFKRIQKEKRILQEKERREAEEQARSLVKVVPYENPEDVRQCAELGSIKQRFEDGVVFKTDTPVKRFDEDLEIKVASKARQKFMQIDQEGPKDANALQLASSTKESKWTKETGPKPEPVNRRTVDGDDDQDADDFEVKKLLNKFKNIEQGKENGEEKKLPKPVRQITPPPADYKSEVVSEGKERDPNVISSTNDAAQPVKVESKSIKAKFESAPEKVEEKLSEEKRKQLEEEFKKLKELKEIQKQNDVESTDTTDNIETKEEVNPDLAAAAEHTQKMRARWDKIQKKEAKKAQKSTNARKPAQAATHFKAGTVHNCGVCSKPVYAAEQIESDRRFYHKPCFKCQTCGISLRLDNSVVSKEGAVYCRPHHKSLFNDMSHPLLHGPSRDSSSRESTPVLLTNEESSVPNGTSLGANGEKRVANGESSFINEGESFDINGESRALNGESLVENGKCAFANGESLMTNGAASHHD